MHVKGFKLKDLTPEQWRKVKEKLLIGHDGYWEKPSLKVFTEKFTYLEPNKKQIAWFSGIPEKETEETETEEEKS